MDLMDVSLWEPETTLADLYASGSWKEERKKEKKKEKNPCANDLI
jgi:hypothetical protein